MDAKAVLKGVTEIAALLGGSDGIRESLLGSYSDGTIRSLPDAWNGEFMSPKEKKKVLYGKPKKHKKKKNKKKKANNQNKKYKHTKVKPNRGVKFTL